MSNKIYGFLSEISNIGYDKPQELFLDRINISFGDNGKNAIKFWEMFFSCGKYHSDCEKFVYIFSEEQLEILYNWWKDKVDNIVDATATTEEKDIKENLLRSKQNIINNYNGSSLYEEDIYACFFSKVNIRRIKVKKLLFNSNMKKKGRVCFFDKDFLNCLIGNKDFSNDSDKLDKILRTLLGSIKEQVNSIQFKDISINKKVGNWLFYNGNKFDFKKPFIYCKKRENSLCPFVKF